VGGGSLIYFNVQIEAPPRIFQRGWPQAITRQTLDPYYALVQDMLDAVPLTPPDGRTLPPRTKAFFDAAQGAGRKAELLKIAVYTGPDRQNPHSGVPQSGCVYSGNCGMGCHVHAKNTLDLNYLPLAEQQGAQVLPLHQVDKIEPAGQGYRVTYRNLQVGETGTIMGKQVLVAAGALGSTELLLRCRDVHKTLPGLSETLGHHFSGNGDFILAGTHRTPRDVNPSEGPSITAGVDFSADDQTIFVEDLGYPEPLLWYLEGDKCLQLHQNICPAQPRPGPYRSARGHSPGPLRGGLHHPLLALPGDRQRCGRRSAASAAWTARHRLERSTQPPHVPADGAGHEGPQPGDRGRISHQHPVDLAVPKALDRSSVGWLPDGR
jgi:hypothetical protein